jgi:diacylglycerol kinase
MNSKRFSFKGRLESFRYAINGLRTLLRDEHNSRIHLTAFIIVFILAVFLKLNPMEWCLVVIITGLVFITELLNSSLESLSDRIDPEFNELIRKAKDYSAAAVLLSALIALITGGIIFIPKLLHLIFTSPTIR